MKIITVYRPPHTKQCPRCKGVAIKKDADYNWECTECYWTDDAIEQERFENEKEENNV